MTDVIVQTGPGGLAGIIKELRAENEKLREAVAWNVEQRGIQAREIERLRAGLEATTLANATFVGAFEEVVRLQAQLHEHDPQACPECSGHPLREAADAVQ